MGKKRRTRKELEALGNMFTSLLQYNERRGRDATGIYIADKNGIGKILKAPISAIHLTESSKYQEAIRSINNKTVTLIGHTRWKTVGTPMVNGNNHPIATERCVGTHNGTIMNHNDLFHEFGWQRTGQVDSEAIFRCADDCIDKRGRLDMGEFSEKLKKFLGTMSFILHNRQEPTMVYIGIGNMPLSLRYNSKLRCLCYSSELMPLVMAGKGYRGWHLQTQSPMTLFRFDIADLMRRDSVPMIFNL
ncbi:class II glutamine amidotransferase [Victivallis lenta]|uniref:class II glutamine amidotransferase n=1 Tax=Victivallis lenta TaxID=2606640 RepID=UPI00197E0534|nr:hypothetical protein [Victivallis lenta]